MNRIESVTGGDQGVVWITNNGVICTAPTDADETYSASVFQAANELRYFVLRKSANLDRLVLAEVGLGKDVYQRIVQGEALQPLGDLSAQTDEQIVNALI